MAKPQADLLLRKSKVVRQGEESLSLRAQEQRGRRWAKEHGYTVRQVWKENLSAWSDITRPKQEAALKALLAGEVGALWAYAMDRWSRKGAESVLPVLGKARLIFDYERLDSSDPRDRRRIIDAAEDAYAYSARLSYNLSVAKATLRGEGRWLGKIPYGLRADKDRKLRPGNGWGDILTAYEMVAGGHSLRQVRDHLHREGSTGPSGKGWSQVTLGRIIHHPVYQGWMTVHVHGRSVPYLNEKGQRVRVTRKKHLARMIPGDLADRARLGLSGRLKTAEKPSGMAEHMLSGRIGCRGCGGPGSSAGLSYGCSRHRTVKNCPEPAMVLRTSLEKYVIEAWSRRLAALEPGDPTLDAIAQRWTALRKPEETAGLREAQGAVKAAEAALERFHEDDRKGFYAGRSARYREPAKRAAEERLDDAEERVAELSGDGVLDIGWLLDGRAEAALEAVEDPQMRRDLIGMALEKIWIKRAAKPGVRFDGRERVEIEWVEGEET